MNDAIIYHLTKNAVQRLIERFPGSVKHRRYLLKFDKRNFEEYNSLFNTLCSESTENKAIPNNSVFMTTYYERYGWNYQFKFLENYEHNLIMVFAKNSSSQCYTLVTVIPSSYWSSKTKGFKKSTKTQGMVWKAITLSGSTKNIHHFEYDHLNAA